VTAGDLSGAGSALACLSCAEWAGLSEASAAALVLLAAIVGRLAGDAAAGWRARQKVSNQVSPKD